MISHVHSPAAVVEHGKSPVILFRQLDKSTARVFFTRKPLGHHPPNAIVKPATVSPEIFKENNEQSIDTKPCDQLLHIGLRFGSFAEFEALFEKWKAANYHPFRVASSETLRLSDGSVDPVFKYRYIVYHCAHYGLPRIRGSGKRRNQNYLPCGCQAMLRLNYSWSENALRLTTLCSVHSGHVTSAEAYEQFTGKRMVRSIMAARSTGQRSDSGSELSSPPPLPLADQSPPTALHLQPNNDGDDYASDERSDEDRFEMIHAVLQGISDHLLKLEGATFDTRLTELQATLKSWQRAPSAPRLAAAPNGIFA